MNLLLIVLPFLILLAISIPIGLRILRYDGERRLPPGRLKPIRSFVADFSDGTANADFWKALGGNKGLWRLFIQLGDVIGCLQHCVHEGSVTRSEALQVYAMGCYQVGYTFLAMIESIACRLFRRAPHYMAFGAARFHWNATMRTMTLCQYSPWFSSRSLL